MAGNVDQRVIQMQFENRQFEKNIAKSKKSLEDFKEAMNFDDTSRDLERFSKTANRLSFEGLFNNIQKLTDRFTGLGDAGDYVLRRIRAGIEGAAMQMENFAKSISVAQISIGQGKYDALNKAVMTIVSTGKYTEQQAYDVFDRLMTYTNETSYSFSDMVNQIATFTSTGRGLEESERAMEGIANLSAKAGQGVQQATNAMQIFAKSLGQGFMGLQQWESLNLSAHVITEEFRQVLADTAVEMGTLTKKGDKYYTATKKGKKELVEIGNLERTLNKEWATSAVLMATLQKYYFQDIDDPNANWDTFAGTAAKAAQRALNLTDAINAMKESVSGGWMETWRIVFGDLTDAMKLFTDIANRAIESLEKFSSWRNNILKIWSREGGRQSLIDTILGDYGKTTKTGAYGFIDMLDDTGKIVYDAFVDFVGIFAGKDDRLMFKEDPEYFQAWLGIKLNKITESVQNFMQGIRDWFNEEIQVGGETKTRLQIIHEILMGVVAALALGYQVLTGLGTFFLELAGQLQPSFDKIEAFLATLGLTLYETTAEATEAKTIPQFFHELAETFRPLTEGINEVVGAFMELLMVLLETDGEKKTSKNFFTFLGDALKFVAGIITSVGVPVLSFIKNLIKLVKELFTGKKSETDPSKGLLGSLGDLISGIVSGFNTNGFENLHKRFEAVMGWFKTVNLGSLLGAILGGLSVAAIIHMIFRIGTAFKKISMFFEDPGGALKQGLLGNYEFFSERLLNIAKGIALIAASVVILGSMDTGALIQGVIAVAALMGAMFLFTKLMSDNATAGFFKQIATTANIMGIALAFAGMAVAMAILITALRPLQNMTWDQFGKMMAGMGGVLLQLIAFMVIIKACKVKTTRLGGFIAFALSMAILINALKPFASMNWDQYGRAMAGLGGVLLELIAAMVLIKTFKVRTAQLGGFIAFAISLAILVLAITPFAGMNWDQYAKAMAGLGGVLLELIAAMVIMRSFGVGIAQLSGFIAFALSLAILVQAITPFASMNWDQYAKAMAGLGGVLLELIAAMIIMRSFGIGIVQLSGFIAFALSLAILVQAITPFAGMNWDQYARAMAGLGGVLLELIAAMVIMRSFGVGVGYLGGFILFAASIWLIIESIKPFADMSWDQYAKCMAGLGGVLLELIIAMGLMSLIPVTGIAKAAVAFLIVGVVMGMFANALNKVKDIKWEVIAAFAAGFSAIILAIAGALIITSSIGSLKGVIVLAAGLAALMAVVSLLAQWLLGSIGSGLADMSSKLAIMADMMSIFSTRMAGVDEGGIDKATQMVEGLKVLMGNISTFGAISISASSFSTAMFNLGTGLEIFSNHAKKIDSATIASSIKMIKDLAGCAMNLKTMSSLNIDLLSAKLSGLGGAMMLYAKGAREAGGLQGEDVTDVSGAILILSELSDALVKNGGFTIPQNMPDEEALGLFGAQLAALAGALIMFEEAGQGLGDGTAEALKTLKFFKELKEQLVSIDFLNNIGFVGDFNAEMAAEGLGRTELETFGTNIEQLGLALKAFAESTTTVDEATGEIKPTSYDAAIEALNKFSDLANSLPTIGGIRSWWTGNRQKLSELGSDIQQLGSGLMTFSNKITGKGNEGQKGVTFDETAASAVFSAIDAIIEFIQKTNEKLPKLGGLGNFFSTLFTGRDYNFKDLGDQVGQMGEGLGKLGEGLNKGKWNENTGAEYALSALNSIMDLLIKFSELYKLGVVASGVYAADQISQFIDAFAVDGSGIQSLVFMMNEISDEFNQYQGNIDPSKIEAFKNMAEAIADLASINPSYDWSVVGMSIDTGIAEGLIKGESIVTAAAQEVALAAYTAAMSALEAGSPSRLFMDVGGFIGQGMAIGINNSMDVVGSAATSMSEEAVNNAKDVIATISRIMAEDVNSQPTISPVLDMTNVTNGMNDFGRSLNGKTVSLNTAVAASMAGRSVSNEGSSVNQNRTNFEGIYSRINLMNQQISALGTKIASMKLVLDTGVLAGGVTDGVDNNLGRREFYAQRRN